MILYFSAEGNSQYVAKKIAGQTNDQVFSIRKAMSESRYDLTVKAGENFGLVVPVYFHYLPTIVQDYLKKVSIHLEGEDHYSFFIATYGMAYGNIGSAAQKILAGKGVTLDATFSICMVDTWNPYFDMTDKDYIASAESKGEKELADVVQKIKNHTSEFLADTWTEKEQEDTLASYEEYRDTRKFSVDTRKCISCGLCARQCPMDRIHLESGHPVWDGDKCTLCLGCVHRCPVNAIQYTEDTVGHGQYINKKAGAIV